MPKKIGEFRIGLNRLSLFQDRVNGQIYHIKLSGEREVVTPLPNGKVQAFEKTSLTISPQLPKDVLETYKARRTARKK